MVKKTPPETHSITLSGPITSFVKDGNRHRITINPEGDIAIDPEGNISYEKDPNSLLTTTMKNYQEQIEKEKSKIIECDQSSEKKRWDRHIKPIIKKHNIRDDGDELFQYQFFDKQITHGDMNQMLRNMMSICRRIVFPTASAPSEIRNDPYGGSVDFFKEIVFRLRDKESPQEFPLKDGGGPVDLSDTFRDFLEETLSEGTLPEFLELLRIKTEYSAKEKAVVLRADQQDKQQVQSIARQVWGQSPHLAIKYMEKHPEIKKIAGRRYKPRTVRQWLSEIAPDPTKKQGRLSKKAEAEQIVMCKKLGISN